MSRLLSRPATHGHQRCCPPAGGKGRRSGGGGAHRCGPCTPSRWGCCQLPSVPQPRVLSCAPAAAGPAQASNQLWRVRLGAAGGLQVAAGCCYALPTACRWGVCSPERCAPRERARRGKPCKCTAFWPLAVLVLVLGGTRVAGHRGGPGPPLRARDRTGKLAFCMGPAREPSHPLCLFSASSLQVEFIENGGPGRNAARPAFGVGFV